MHAPVIARLKELVEKYTSHPTMIETLYTPFGTLTDHYGEQKEQGEQGEREHGEQGEQGERERHNSQQHNTPTQFQNRTHKHNHHHRLTFKGGRSTE